MLDLFTDDLVATIEKVVELEQERTVKRVRSHLDPGLAELEDFPTIRTSVNPMKPLMEFEDECEEDEDPCAIIRNWTQSMRTSMRNWAKGWQTKITAVRKRREEMQQLGCVTYSYGHICESKGGRNACTGGRLWALHAPLPAIKQVIAWQCSHYARKQGYKQPLCTNFF